MWDQKDFMSFLQNYERQKSNFLRARVQEGLGLYKEYFAKYLANNYFDEILPQVLQSRKVIRELTGYDIDFKGINKEFGKKKAAKKSQMRTIIEVFTVPVILLVFLLSFLVALSILGCLWCCCSKPDKKAKKE
jgi:hypothetical protein